MYFFSQGVWSEKSKTKLTSASAEAELGTRTEHSNFVSNSFSLKNLQPYLYWLCMLSVKPKTTFFSQVGGLEILILKLTSASTGVGVGARAELGNSPKTTFKIWSEE